MFDLQQEVSKLQKLSLKQHQASRMLSWWGDRTGQRDFQVSLNCGLVWWNWGAPRGKMGTIPHAPNHKSKPPTRGKLSMTCFECHFVRFQPERSPPFGQRRPFLPSCVDSSAFFPQAVLLRRVSRFSPIPRFTNII